MVTPQELDPEWKIIRLGHEKMLCGVCKSLAPQAVTYARVLGSHTGSYTEGGHSVTVTRRVPAETSNA